MIWIDICFVSLYEDKVRQLLDTNTSSDALNTSYEELDFAGSDLASSSRLVGGSNSRLEGTNSRLEGTNSLLDGTLRSRWSETPSRVDSSEISLDFCDTRKFLVAWHLYKSPFPSHPSM